MKHIPYYMMLVASSLKMELTPEERKNLNKFLRGNLAD